MNITETELQELQQIETLLDEAYDHYFEHSDGYCKSSEGLVKFDFTTYFDRRDGEGMKIKSVLIYSYVLGPQRWHSFDTTTEALAAVTAWHQDEMARTHDDDDRILPIEKLLNSGDQT